MHRYATGCCVVLTRRHSSDQHICVVPPSFVLAFIPHLRSKEVILQRGVDIQEMVWIPLLQAHVKSGDFLLACVREEAAPSICRIIDVASENELRVTWWWKAEELLSFVGLEALPPLSGVTHGNLQQCHLIEVAERALSVSTITLAFMKDIAFVFHADVFETELLNCAGMNKVFYTRYCYDGNDRLLLVDCHHFNPFSNNMSYESYPSRIWWSTLDIKDNVAKLLNDTKQYQSLKKSVAIRFSLESWLYLIRCIQLSNPIYIEYHRNQTYKLLHHDLTLSSHSRKIFLKLLRIDSPRTMQCARQIFGNTFGVGIRNRAPNKGNPPRSMHHGDIVNVVNVSNDQLLDYDERRKEFTCAQGVDFIYNDKCRMLKIRVRYTRVEAQADVVFTTLNLTQRPLVNPNDRVIIATHIIPGTFFVRLGELVQVVSVDGNEVVITDDYGEHLTIELAEASQLLKDYLG